MALIKCSECGQEISTQARVCPHCGNPNVPAAGEAKEGFNDLTKMIVRLILLGLLLGGIYYLAQRYEQLNASFSGAGTFTGNLNQALHRGDYRQVLSDLFPPQNESATAPASGETEVPLQDVKNLGVEFNLGQIDEGGVDDLTDDLKNQITKTIYAAHIPEIIMKNTPIIILNNLALTGNQYIPATSGNLKVPDLKPDFLSEGGLYATFKNGGAVIFINKPIIAQGQLSGVLAHELGHAIGSTFTDNQWKTFYRLRNIPAGTPRRGTIWNLSPEEDFAEVYKNVFTGGSVQTFYGLLEPAYGFDMTCNNIYQDVLDSYMPKSDPNNPATWFMSSGADYASAESKASANPKVQVCRRAALSNPAKWDYGMPPYKATVGPKTKQFIEMLIASSSRL